MNDYGYDENTDSWASRKLREQNYKLTSAFVEIRTKHTSASWLKERETLRELRRLSEEEQRRDKVHRWKESLRT